MRQYIEFDKPQDAFPAYVKHRLEGMRQGFVMIITGSPATKIGSGKTMAAARIAESIDPDFRSPPYTSKFTLLPSEFLKRMNEVAKSGKRGQVVILDEAEIGISSREWLDARNRAVAQACNVFREICCMAIIIAPLFADIDKRIRKLVSIWAYPELYLGKGRDGNIKVRLKVYRIKTDILGEEMRLSKLRFFDKNQHRIISLRHLEMSLPSPELKKAIEEKQTPFKHKVISNAEEAAERAEGKLNLGIVQERATQEMNDLLNKAFSNEIVLAALKKEGKVDRDLIDYALPYARGKAPAIARAINLKYGLSKNEPATAATPDR